MSILASNCQFTDSTAIIKKAFGTQIDVALKRIVCVTKLIAKEYSATKLGPVMKIVKDKMQKYCKSDSFPTLDDVDPLQELGSDLQPEELSKARVAADAAGDSH